MELLPQTAEQAEAGQETLWHKAPAWRSLTVAASLLTLAALAVPALLPQEQPMPAPLAALETVSATPSVTLSPLPPPPAHKARVATAQPLPAAGASVPAAAPSDLPVGGLVIPSGVLTRVNQHNRHLQGQDLPVTITIITPPSHGQVTTAPGTALLQIAPGVRRNSAMTQVFYQSATGYTGRDSFTYKRTSPDPTDPFNANIYTMVIDVK